MKHVSFATSGQFEWNQESVLDFINNVEGLECEIVLNVENIILVAVKSYNTIKHLAKTTNWCISKNKTYWNNYMGNSSNTQYVLFNFNCKEDEECSIVGFTTNHLGTITHAHSFTNINMMEGEGCGPVELTSFLEGSPSIFSLLKKLKVPMNLFLKLEEKFYDWNKDSFIACLNKSIPEEDYSILAMSETTLVMSTRHANVRYLIGEDVFTRIVDDMESSTTPCEYMLFCDFTKNRGPLTAIISTHQTNFTQKCEDVYDEFGIETECGAFESLLKEYDLPFNIIRRSQDKISNFKSDFNHYRLSNISTALDDEEIREYLMKKEDDTLIRLMYEIFLESLRSHYSLDLIKMVYAKGMSLTDLLTPSHFSKLLYGIAYHYTHHASHGRKRDIPTPEDIARFHDGTLKRDNCIWVGMFVALDLIMTNETRHEYYTEDFGRLFRQGSHRPFFKYLSEKWLNIADLTQFNRGLSQIFTVACDLRDEDIMAILQKDTIHPQYIMEALPHVSPDHPMYQKLMSKIHVPNETCSFSFHTMG